MAIVDIQDFDVLASGQVPRVSRSFPCCRSFTLTMKVFYSPVSPPLYLEGMGVVGQA